jgi:hypothetical protein
VLENVPDTCCWISGSGGELGSLLAEEEHSDGVVCTERHSCVADSVRSGEGSAGHSGNHGDDSAALPCPVVRHGTLLTLPHPMGKNG